MKNWMEVKFKNYLKRNSWNTLHKMLLLVMKLSEHNDFEILDLMNAISTITSVRFERVCHTGISTWWKQVIEDKINNGDCRASNRSD